jgi:hypothetical protein
MTSGRKISYRMELDCQCGAPGSWRIVEQGGEVVKPGTSATRRLGLIDPACFCRRLWIEQLMPTVG